MKNSIYFLLLLSFSSCFQPQKREQELIGRIESRLFNDSTMRPVVSSADSLVRLYLAYAEAYPDDTLSPEYLFRAGDLSQGIGRFDQAIDIFGKVQRYPNYQKAGTASFLRGFVAENSKGDTALARKYYEQFLQTYPSHPLNSDAKLSLDYLGKTPEELMQILEQKQANGNP